VGREAFGPRVLEVKTFRKHDGTLRLYPLIILPQSFRICLDTDQIAREQFFPGIGVAHRSRSRTFSFPLAGLAFSAPPQKKLFCVAGGVVSQSRNLSKPQHGVRDREAEECTSNTLNPIAAPHGRGSVT
jgi:hypothetical protein